MQKILNYEAVKETGKKIGKGVNHLIGDIYALPTMSRKYLN